MPLYCFCQWTRYYFILSPGIFLSFLWAFNYILPHLIGIVGSDILRMLQNIFQLLAGMASKRKATGATSPSLAPKCMRTGTSQDAVTVLLPTLPIQASAEQDLEGGHLPTGSAPSGEPSEELHCDSVDPLAARSSCKFILSCMHSSLAQGHHARKIVLFSSLDVPQNHKSAAQCQNIQGINSAA